MKSVHIRDVDPATLAALKRLARSHRRSLQGELHAILEKAARSAPPDDQQPVLITIATGRSGSTWPRSEIYDDQGR